MAAFFTAFAMFIIYTIMSHPDPTQPYQPRKKTMTLNEVIAHEQSLGQPSDAVETHPPVVVSKNDPLVNYGQMKPPRPGSIHEAAMRGDIGALNGHLLPNGANVNVPDGDIAWTPLHWAAWKGGEPITKALLTWKANPNAGDASSMTPLHVATMQDNTLVVLTLLEGGAQIDARNRWGYTPLHIASANGRVAVVMALLERKASINAKTESGEAPLHVAYYPEITAHLLRWGADWRVRDNGGVTPLGLATRMGNTETVKVLRQWGATE